MHPRCTQAFPDPSGHDLHHDLDLLNAPAEHPWRCSRLRGFRGSRVAPHARDLKGSEDATLPSYLVSRSGLLGWEPG
jgi:hypothetical protein